MPSAIQALNATVILWERHQDPHVTVKGAKPACDTRPSAWLVDDGARIHIHVETCISSGVKLMPILLTLISPSKTPRMAEINVKAWWRCQPRIILLLLFQVKSITGADTWEVTPTMPIWRQTGLWCQSLEQWPIQTPAKTYCPSNCPFWIWSCFLMSLMVKTTSVCCSDDDL